MPKIKEVFTRVDGAEERIYPTARNVPAEYQEVERIGSSGSQWIDTGVTPTSNTLSQIKFINLAATGDVIYGMYNGNDNADYRFFNASGRMYFDLNSSRIEGSSVNTNTLYELEIGNYYVKNVGDTSNILSGSAVSGYTGSTTIKLNRSDGQNVNSQNKWYYVKIREGTTQVRNFIPCYRKSDNVIGLYDTIGQQFYTNSGSGTFTKGNDV